MQFVPDGPDIPNELLQAHEEGRVVFFCGAGISYPAGLPGFEGLVEGIYTLTYAVRLGVEQRAFCSKEYDKCLHLLEQRLPGGSSAVRLALEKILTPKPESATDTQAALLRLGRSREGKLQLVTTNFDRLFHWAAKRTGQDFKSYTAPELPIPKNSRWDGLVYLHGLLPADGGDERALDQLVVTSGDFGLAYLSEGWAARFVRELFRNYVVCFVGYSISDPMLRYMMDALAADRMRGEDAPRAWALGSFESGQESQEATRESQEATSWKAKGVEPILYRSHTAHDHSLLHQTLDKWADTYRDDMQGKEAIVTKYACSELRGSTKQDNFVGRMLWALSDKSGVPAKHFAGLNPAPPLDWLYCFSGQNEVISQPHLADWLARHLDDPKLLIWMAKESGQLGDGWPSVIRQQLNYLASLERDGKNDELDGIRLNSPRAIPGPSMRTLWRLLLSGRVKSPQQNTDQYPLHDWERCLELEGLTTPLRLELRGLLAPRVTLKPPFPWGNDMSTDQLDSISQLVNWEIVLAADDVRYTLGNLANNEHWKSGLPHLLGDFQQLLRDALDLSRELGGANDHHDQSLLHLPSIEPHWQNRDFRDWVILIEVLRDAWLEVRITESARAAHITRDWFELPYPTFKRLALFAASRDDGCIPSEQWVEWLLADSGRWLWSEHTQREVCRLFAQQGQRLTRTAQERLEAAILAGPPHRDDLEPDRWLGLVDRPIWLRLDKLKQSGLILGEFASARPAEISQANESDEFPYWMEDNLEVDIAPRKRQDLVQWLKRPPERGPFSEDTWGDVCRKHMLNSLCALRDLADDGVWPLQRWTEALRVWGREGKGRRVKRSWRYAAPLVLQMLKNIPGEMAMAHTVTWWMQATSKAITLNAEDESILLQLCDCVLDLPLEAATGSSDSVFGAINHPVEHITEVLVKLCLRRDPNDGDQIPDNIKPFFTRICDVQVDWFRPGRVDWFRPGRVVLGLYLITLFRLDRLWTDEHLLPLFSWDNPTEAKAMWQHFLRSPRVHLPLFTAPAFKPQFLESARHYDDLGEHRQVFASFLTSAALEPIEGYTTDDFRSVIAALPLEGLEQSARELSKAIEGAASQREEYWKNRVQPFWQNVWPKDRKLVTPRIIQSLILMALAARGEFPAALAEVKYWLQPIGYLHYILDRLSGSGLCSKSPEAALQLLYEVINAQSSWSPDLGQCLDKIAQADPNLAQDPRYLRLREHCRQHGM